MRKPILNATLFALAWLIAAPVAHAGTAEPAAPVLRLKCQFSERVSKGSRHACTATIVTGDRMVIDCEGRGERRFTPLFSGIQDNKTKLGIFLFSTQGGSTPGFPAIYINEYVLDPAFSSAPANLRFDSDGRALHGFCEKETEQ